MPAAKDTRPTKFPSFEILYEDDEFAIAWGLYDDEKPERLAMRWTGGKKKVGYPRQGKSSTWFMLPEQMSVPVVKALLGVKFAKNETVLEVLKQLHSTKRK